MSSHTKLIILRGNSGSGKSTTAKALQKKFGYGTMLISQDVIRRELLYVKDGIDTKAIPLLIDLAAYGRKNCEVVIIEGILNATWYQGLFDLPFEETLIRHMKKPNCNDFGEAEMRKWWMEKDYIGIIKEKIIRKELSLDEIVSMIYSDIIRGY